MVLIKIYQPVGDPEEGPGEGRRHLIFRPNWGPRGRQKIFFQTPPPSLPPHSSESLDPPQPTYQEHLWDWKTVHLHLKKVSKSSIYEPSLVALAPTRLL